MARRSAPASFSKVARCEWSHNQEDKDFAPELMLLANRCVRCGKCADACAYGALEMAGREYSVQEVLEIVLRDRPFYGDQGGMTLTGGEPWLSRKLRCHWHLYP